MDNSTTSSIFSGGLLIFWFVWLGAGTWGFLLLALKGYLNSIGSIFKLPLLILLLFWWVVPLLALIPMGLGPITLLVAYLAPRRGALQVSQFEMLTYALPVQVWIQGPGFYFGAPEGWMEWPTDTLAEFSTLTQQPTLVGAQKTLQDGSNCWLAVVPSHFGMSEVTKSLRATTAQLAAVYRQAGITLLSEPRRVLIDGEPSMVTSVQLANGIHQEQVSTSHQGRSYGIVYQGTSPQIVSQLLPDFYTVLATWRWL